MQILRAKYGKQYNFTADPETLQKLRHCRQFAERMLELKASEGVLLRRAVELLLDHYDKLYRKLKRGNKDAKEYEIYGLKQISEPIFYDKLPEIPKDKPFMSYEARLARERKNPRDRILKEASRGYNSKQTYRYWD